MRFNLFHTHLLFRTSTNFNDVQRVYRSHCELRDYPPTPDQLDDDDRCTSLKSCTRAEQ